MSTPEAALRIPLRKDDDGNVLVSHLIPGRDFICDQEFNIGRTIDPRDSNGDVMSLIGSVGSGSLLEDVHQNITLRPALEEEKTRWLEIHSQDEYLAGVEEDARAEYVPAWISADGFGRCEAHMAAHPNFDQRLACAYAESIANQNQAIIYGTVKNSAVRGSHFLDVYRGMKAAQEEKYKQNQIAVLFRCSAGKVSIILKICGKLTEADIRKIVKDGASFQSVEKMIKKRHPNLISKKESDAAAAAATTTGTKLVTLSGGKRNLYVSSFDRAMTDMDEDSVNHHILMAAQFTMRYVSGEFEEKSFLEAAQSCSLLEDMDFNFEHDPAADAPPAAPAAPAAVPVAPVVKKKAAGKKKASKKASKKPASKKAAAGGSKKKASKKKTPKKKVVS